MSSYNIKKPIPYSFVLDELVSLEPYTKPMFGCTAVYVGDKIVLILRDKKPKNADNGVWIATTAEHHVSLKKDIPSMRSIKIFSEKGPSGWQNIPSGSTSFEEDVLKVCSLVLAGDERVGKIPNRKKSKKKNRI